MVGRVGKMMPRPDSWTSARDAAAEVGINNKTEPVGNRVITVGMKRYVLRDTETCGERKGWWTLKQPRRSLPALRSTVGSRRGRFSLRGQRREDAQTFPISHLGASCTGNTPRWRARAVKGSLPCASHGLLQCSVLSSAPPLPTHRVGWRRGALGKKPGL